MSPDKFRLWIVILIGAAILTMWASIGMKMCKYSKHGKMWKKCSHMGETNVMPKR